MYLVVFFHEHLKRVIVICKFTALFKITHRMQNYLLAGDHLLTQVLIGSDLQSTGNDLDSLKDQSYKECLDEHHLQKSTGKRLKE